MAKTKTIYTDEDVLKFIHTFANTEQKKQDSYALIELMKEMSDHEPKMWGPTIVGFGSYHYKYESGHEGDAPMLGFSPRKAAMMIKANQEGTANVVNICIDQKVEKLVFVSSVAALGRIREDAPIDETMHWTPETSNSVYGKSKYLAEMEVWRAMAEGLNIAIVNPVIIFGAGDWNKGSSEIFKSSYHQFPWYTNGISGFVDVLDVVDAMQLLMDSPIVGERYIISAENLSYQTVFTQIANAFAKKPPRRKVTPLLAAIVWRLEAVKSLFTGKTPLLTKETAATAQAKVYFNNQKFLKAFPAFQYRSMDTTIKRVSAELMEMHQLN